MGAALFRRKFLNLSPSETTKIDNNYINRWSFEVSRSCPKGNCCTVCVYTQAMVTFPSGNL